MSGPSSGTRTGLGHRVVAGQAAAGQELGIDQVLGELVDARVVGLLRRRSLQHSSSFSKRNELPA